MLEPVPLRGMSISFLHQPVAMLMCIGRNASRNQERSQTRSVYRQSRKTSHLRNWRRAGSKALLPDFGAWNGR